MYCTIDSEMWDDPKVRSLDVWGKALLPYMFGNRHRHVTGLYYFSCAIASEELNLDITPIKKAFKKLCDIGICDYDVERRVVFVRNHWKRQPHAGVHLDRLQTYFKTLHGTPLVAAFLRKYPDMKRHVTDLSLISTNRSPDCADLNDSALLKLEQEQELELEQKQEGECEGGPVATQPQARTKLPLLKKKEDLEKALDSVDLEPLRTEFEPQGLNFDRWWQETRKAVLEGTAQKPYPNPFKWRDFSKALRNSCIGAIERGLYVARASPQPKPSWRDGTRRAAEEKEIASQNNATSS